MIRVLSEILFKLEQSESVILSANEPIENPALLFSNLAA